MLMRGYFVGKLPEIGSLLAWAEKQGMLRAQRRACTMSPQLLRTGTQIRACPATSEASLCATS